MVLYVSALLVSALIFACGLLAALVLRRKKLSLKPLHVVMITTFVALAAVFYPVYYDGFYFEGKQSAVLALLLAAYRALTAFVINADIGAILAGAASMGFETQVVYVSFSACLCLVAPVLTFSLALSMIKRFSAYWNGLLGYWRPAYVFSALNEKSLALAQSILEQATQGQGEESSGQGRSIHTRRQGDTPLIAFAGAYGRDDSLAASLMEEAVALGALCFKEDIASLPLWAHSPAARITLVIIGDESNITHIQLVRLMELAGEKKWRRTKELTWLYLLEASPGEAHLTRGRTQGQVAGLTIRRIEKVRSFVYNFLWRQGKEALFDTAVAGDGPACPERDALRGAKEIRVFLIGLGKTGSMMLRSLIWFGQMEGYTLTIDAFDVSKAAESHVQALCPELLDAAHNNQWLPGNAQYQVRFHSEVNVFSAEFTSCVQGLSAPSFVFISLGNDDTNIEAAGRVKTQLLQKSKLSAQPHTRFPEAIHVVVHDPHRCKALESDPSFKRVGDFESMYSYETILDQELEKKAEEVHTYWYKNDPSSLKRAKEEYWHSEYYRNSSMAEVIHREARDALLLASKRPAESCVEACSSANASAGPSSGSSARPSAEALAMLEHRRWLAYLRSEGYAFSGSTNESSRCDEAKLHNLLVPYDSLPESEKKLSYDA